LIAALKQTVVTQTQPIDLFETVPATEAECQKEDELQAMAEEMNALNMDAEEQGQA